MFKIISMSVLLLIFTACGKTETTVAYDNHTPAYNGPLSWNQSSFPIVIQVPSDLSLIYKDAIENATQRWNTALQFNAFSVVYDEIPNNQWSAQYQSLNDTIMGLYKMNSWNFGESANTLATTVTLSRSGRLNQADILFNFSGYKFSDVDKPDLSYGVDYVDYESVLTHELGHFLGLNHTSANEDSNSVMNPSLSKASKKRILSNGDINRIRTLYGL